MDTELIERFIEENRDEAHFTGGVGDDIITHVEERLGVKFPVSYKWFLSKYGYGSLFGVEILGCGKAGTPPVVSVTQQWRQLGLPNSHVVIEDCDEFVYCLDTEKECPVVAWDRAGYRGVRAMDFIEFLFNSLEEAKENW